MSVFRFKEFDIVQNNSAMKVGTDAMVLGALINSQNKESGLDVGGGTGVLSLMIAQNNNTINIDAVELDEASAIECKSNFESSSWSDRLNVHYQNFLDFQSEEKFDLIFSNPPYYQSNLPNDNERKANARHEKSLPLKEFVSKVSTLLTDSGEFWFIVPAEDQQSWKKACTAAQMHMVEKILVHGKKGAEAKRVIFVFSKEREILEESNFTIREKSGDYTQEYKELTKDFHFNKL